MSPQTTRGDETVHERKAVHQKDADRCGDSDRRSRFFYDIQQNGFIKPALPEGLIQANGRIEGETHVVATKIAGRITNIMAQEGDSVKSGQILAQLGDSQIREKVNQAAFAFEAATARVKATETAYGLMKKQVPIQTSCRRRLCRTAEKRADGSCV